MSGEKKTRRQKKLFILYFRFDIGFDAFLQ
jgi:hypothetical protein